MAVFVPSDQTAHVVAADGLDLIVSGQKELELLFGGGFVVGSLLLVAVVGDSVGAFLFALGSTGAVFICLIVLCFVRQKT